MPGNIGSQFLAVLAAPLITGAYNTPVRDWTQATTTVIAGCTIDYTSASETREASDQTVTRAQAFLPPRAPQVTADMRVQWDGRTWEVDGVPARAEAAGPLGGQTLTLLEVAG